MELLEQLAVTAENEPVEVSTPSGSTITMQVKRLRSVGEFMAFQRVMEGRANAYRVGKNKLAVKLTPELADEAEKLQVAGLTRNPDGSGAVEITAAEEYELATVLEQAAVEPKLTWPEAVLMCKINAGAAIKIAAAWNRINAIEALELEKKESPEQAQE